MSYSKQKETLYSTTRSQNNQLINTLCNVHDLTCGCEDPPSHLTYLLIANTNPQKFNKEEKQKITEWHGTLTDTAEEETTGFDAGDLEQLFAEDDGTQEG